MIYLDSSLVVTALTTAAVQAWLRQQLTGELRVSWWTDTEVASALAQKHRAGALDDRQRLAVMAVWQRLRSGWIEVAVERHHFASASALTAHGLRAADALHLAVANDMGASIATRDASLARVAGLIGLAFTVYPD